MNGKRLRVWLGAGLLSATAIFMIAYGWSANESRKLTVVTVKAGSEKEPFLNNPKVVKELREEYKLDVRVTVAGSRKIAKEGNTHDLLWPATSIDAELHSRLYGGIVEQRSVFQSPLVFFVKKDVVKVLKARGIVEEQNGNYLLIDMKQFAGEALKGTTWADWGLPQYAGPVGFKTSDPTSSASAASLAGLLAVVETGTQPTQAEIPARVQKIQDYFSSLGFKLRSTDFAFVAALTQGDHGVLAYEFEGIQYAILNSGNPEALKYLSDNYVVVYFKQQVWADHPLLATSEKGQALLRALQDDEIEQIAAREHGLRPTATGGKADMSGFVWPRVPDAPLGTPISLPDFEFFRTFDPGLDPNQPKP